MTISVEQLSPELQQLAVKNGKVDLVALQRVAIGSDEKLAAEAGKLLQSELNGNKAWGTGDSFESTTQSERRPYTVEVNQTFDEKKEKPVKIEKEFDNNGKPIREVVDVGADGIPEFIREFDEDGHVLKETHYNKDGKPSAVRDYKYDENGNLMKMLRYGENGKPDDIHEYDQNGNVVRSTYYDEDGNIDSILQSQYDESGNLSEELYYDKNGNLSGRHEYQRDEYGKLLKESYSHNGKLEFVREYNDNGKVKETRYENGKISWSTVREQDGTETNNSYYDGELYSSRISKGRTEKEIHYEKGKPSSITVYQKDERGNVVKELYDRGADGKTDEIIIYQRDKNGNVVKELSDFDADGVADTITRYQRDKNGNVVKEFDSYVDGEPYYIEESQYDEAGNKIKEAIDFGADGIVDVVREYDKAGNEIKNVSYSDEGTPDYIEEFQYDIHGNKIKKSYDNNGDGMFDDVTNCEYDKNGKLVRQSHEKDGKLEYIEEYDKNGRVIKRTVTDINGNVAEVQKFPNPHTRNYEVE